MYMYVYMYVYICMNTRIYPSNLMSRRRHIKLNLIMSFETQSS